MPTTLSGPLEFHCSSPIGWEGLGAFKIDKVMIHWQMSSFITNLLESAAEMESWQTFAKAPALGLIKSKEPREICETLDLRVLPSNIIPMLRNRH